jgi:AcrR family transcriptional regulator
MTPAAFYYHFASKDEILDEIVAAFAHEWAIQVDLALESLSSADDNANAVEALRSWIDDQERAARGYYVTSIGATTTSEAVRRKTRNDLARHAAKAFRHTASREDKVRQAISGLGLMTLLEIAARSRLEMDATYRTLGPVGFRAAAGQLAEALL